MSKTLAQEKRIATIVRRQVTSVLREILSDPDAGLPLRRKTVLRLQQSLQSKKEGKLRELSEVLKKYQR